MASQAIEAKTKGHLCTQRILLMCKAEWQNIQC